MSSGKKAVGRPRGDSVLPGNRYIRLAKEDNDLLTMLLKTEETRTGYSISATAIMRKAVHYGLLAIKDGKI